MEHRHRRLAMVGALVGGVFTSIQGRMNGRLSAQLGVPLEAALWSFGSGLVVLSLLVLAVPAVRRGLARVRASLAEGGLRWYQCIGGLAGALFVAAQSLSVPLIGVALFTVASVAGQTASGLVVDRLGIGPGGPKPVHLNRIAAAVIALVGVVISVWDRLGGGEFDPIPLLVSLVVGGLVAVQQGTNGRVNIASRNVLSTTFMNFVTGTTLLVVIALVRLATGSLTLVSPAGRDVPWWAWFGGLIGIAFIAMSAWAVRHLGVLVFGLVLLTGQVISAVVLDLLSPQTRDLVTTHVVVGVLVTVAAAAMAAWFARPGRTVAR
ncbi:MULTISPECIES: DMT family transporter [unclassified Janibacter]|uniref:DMT family transporter n=1 Tax=unclassified Janibacter TaxID=2649294 RepID=UPI003D03E6BF